MCYNFSEEIFIGVTVSDALIYSSWPHKPGQNLMEAGACQGEAAYFTEDRKQRVRREPEPGVNLKGTP